MKKILILVGLLAAISFAQSASNAVSKPIIADLGHSVAVSVTFTLDSLAGVASADFVLPNGLYNFDASYGQPVTFWKKAVSTHGLPKLDVFLQGVRAGGTDTLALDTICTSSNGEVDTTGILTLNQKRAGKYKLYFRTVAGDVNSGYITLIFPKMYALKP